ncbi:UNVERIFIED_CONTAM: hypothetical protein NCL1_55631 [Trichonephila clavipes]
MAYDSPLTDWLKKLPKIIQIKEVYPNTMVVVHVLLSADKSSFVFKYKAKTCLLFTCSKKFYAISKI